MLTPSDESPESVARLGVIGAGDISAQYARTLRDHPGIEIVRIGGRDPQRAAIRAHQLGVAAGGTIEELLADDRIDLVLNLTPPQAHFETSMRILDAGKHAWSEKPVALRGEEVAELRAMAEARGVRIGVAPDTFLGPGIQRAVRMLRDGAVGAPAGGIAIMQKPGPEAWHPAPEFFYRKGAGPLHDIGVYYLTALTQLLGSIVEVRADGRISQQPRRVATGPSAGTLFRSEVPTTVGAIYRFEGGAQVSALFGFDAHRTREVLEIEGSEGDLAIPDPDKFEGTITLRTSGGSPRRFEAAAAPDQPRAGRGIGALELLDAVREGRPHRASLELAGHVLDALNATLEALDTGAAVSVLSRLPQVMPAR
ncbi:MULTISPECIES: Gfo/Idh/MocA family protein [unclassified Microbacterium]|uniref:Gfo/Idh/MocA family protein n=1 Tax=unclassified Microbacterium TaxID=2609290 RepID=UPI00365142D4